MRCRDFHRLLADWVRGGLSSDSGERMAHHASECRSCGEEAKLERSLRASFRVVAPITQTPDLWERIEARVETAKRPRFAFIFRFQRAIAMGGALAACGFLSVMLLHGHEPVPNLGPNTLVADERSAIAKLSDLHMPESVPAGTYSETPFSGDAARMLLVGGPSR